MCYRINLRFHTIFETIIFVRRRDVKWIVNDVANSDERRVHFFINSNERGEIMLEYKYKKCVVGSILGLQLDFYMFGNAFTSTSFPDYDRSST